MTARQIIQEIEALPLEEQAEIRAHLLNGSKDSAEVQYADRDKVMAVADKIFTERAELFKKLAQ